MEGVKVYFHLSEESFKDPQALAAEAKHQANHKEVLGCLFCSNPNVLQAPRLKLDVVEVCMLHDWFNLCQDTIWSVSVASQKNKHLQLTPRHHV